MEIVLTGTNNDGEAVVPALEWAAVVANSDPCGGGYTCVKGFPSTEDGPCMHCKQP